MKKEHFEILLEKIDSNVEFLVESIDGINGRLDRAEGERGQLFEGQEKTHLRLRRLEEGQARLEGGLTEVRDELRGTRHTVGLLHTIATAHETRLQDVENTLRDHLDEHG